MNMPFRRQLALTLAASLSWSAAMAQEDEAVIGAGKSVTIDYTVTLDDGTVVDTSAGGEPLTYVHGTEELLAALEAALAGMSVGERRSVSLDVDEAYGAVDPDAFREVALENVPESARRIGAQLRFRDSPDPMTVHEIREETIVLNLNNPLAGEALTFDVHVLAIED